MRTVFISLVLFFAAVAILPAQEQPFEIEIPDCYQPGDITDLEDQGNCIYHWYCIVPDSSLRPLEVYMKRTNINYMYGVPERSWIPIDRIQQDNNIATSMVYLSRAGYQKGWYLLGKGEFGGGGTVYYLEDVLAIMGYFNN